MTVCDKVIRAKKGDDNAFSLLIQERKEKLYRTAFAYVKNEQIALDVVGETVLKAYKGIRKLNTPAYFDTWLIRILINSAINALKQSRKIVPLNEEVLLESMKYQEKDYNSIDLLSAIDCLDEKHKNIIILKYFQDLTITQVAEILQMPVGTAKTYLHRALKKLRIELREECFDG